MGLERDYHSTVANQGEDTLWWTVATIRWSPGGRRRCAGYRGRPVRRSFSVEKRAGRHHAAPRLAPEQRRPVAALGPGWARGRV